METEKTKKSGVRRTTGWLLVAVGILLFVVVSTAPAQSGHGKDVTSAAILPVILIAAGLYFAERKEISGVLLVLCGALWGYAAISAAHKAGVPVSGLIGAAVLPILVVAVGLYLLGVIKRFR